MFIGNYSAALIAKGARPRTPLWILFAAAQLVDIGWALLVLLGLEGEHLDPLKAAGHSFWGTAGWSMLALAAAWWWLSSIWGAVGVAMVVMAHFMTNSSWMGGMHRVGLGAWNASFGTEVLEVVLLVAGMAWCLKGCRVASETRPAWWWGVVGLAAFQIALCSSRVPSSLAIAAWIVLLAGVFFAALAWRLERLYALQPAFMVDVASPPAQSAPLEASLLMQKATA